MMGDELLDISELLGEHSEVVSEVVRSSSDMEFDADLEQFLQETQDEVELIQGAPADETPVAPYLRVDRVTVQEIDVYKKEGLFVKRPENGIPDRDMQLCVKLDDEVVVVGWVRVCLRTFLKIKKLCNSRKIFVHATDGMEEELTMDHISGTYLLEAI